MVSRARSLGLSQNEVIESTRRLTLGRFLETALSSRDVIEASRVVPNTSQEWFSAADDRLDHLMGLPEDWDGYGAPPVAEEVRTTVMKLLDNVLSPNDAMPSLVPGSQGEVSMEWRRPGLVFEIEVGPAGHLSAYYCDDAVGGEEWELDYIDIEPRVGELLSRFSEA